MARTTALVSLLLLFTGMVFAQDDADETVVSPDDATAGEALAFDREGELCITTRAIRSTDIIDDRTILFEMRGGDYYVNNLTRTCRGLKREGRFSYRVSIGRLCSVDMIRVLERFGRGLEEGIGCGLGQFFPITEEEAELLGSGPGERAQIEVENPNEGDGEEEETAQPEGQNDDATAL